MGRKHLPLAEFHDMDSKHAIDSVQATALRGRRKPARVLIFLLALAALAVVIAFIVVKRRPNLEWYASPPIDPQGRRVHVLVPVGWQPVGGLEPGASWVNDATNSLSITSISRQGEHHETLVQKWMRMAHLIPANEPSGVVLIEVGPNVNRNWNDPKHRRINVDGKVYVLTDSVAGEWLGRVIPIRGSDKLALVVYVPTGTKQERNPHASAICESMYVE